MWAGRHLELSTCRPVESLASTEKARLAPADFSGWSRSGQHQPAASPARVSTEALMLILAGSSAFAQGHRYSLITVVVNTL